METENLQIHLNSRNLKHGSINDAYFYVNTIEVPSDYSLHLSVLSASIPYSFYNVNNNNNTFILKIGSNTYTYTLRTGNFSINDFLLELQSTITLLTTTYDKIKSKFTFSYITNFSISSSSNCLQLIVFADTNLLNSITNSITYVNCINLQ